MSGGAYDYAYSGIEMLAEEIDATDNPLRVRFVSLLRLVAAAAREIEWVDSGDSSPGSENAAILAALAEIPE